MIPGLRAANVVFQNQRTGDLTMLNSATTAFVSETSMFPDVQNIATFYRKTALQIAEIIADAQGTEKRKN